MKSIFGIVIICFQFLIPFVIIIYCDAKIVWMLTKRIRSGMDLKIKNVKEGNSTKDNQEHTKSNAFQIARRNTIKTLLIVGCCFVTCWSQNQFLYLFYNMGYSVDFNSNYFQFTVFMVFLNSTINPFVYLFKYRDYQNALKKLCSCSRNEQGDSQSQCSSNQSNSHLSVTASSCVTVAVHTSDMT